jgi:hypothetical protein
MVARDDARADGGLLDAAPRVARALALLAFVAALLSRVVEPALPGVWVGIDHLITAVRLVAAGSAQLFAVSSAATVVLLVVHTAKSALPAWLRAASVAAGGLVALAVMIASTLTLPASSGLVLGGAAAALGVLVAVHIARYYTLRAAALVLALLAGAGIVRLGAVAVAEWAGPLSEGPLLLAVRIASTVAWVFHALALVVSAVWTATHNGGGSRVWRGVLLALVAAATVMVVLVAKRGEDPEASGVVLFVARATRQLVVEPGPFIPILGQWVVACAAQLVVPFVLTTVRDRILAGAVALGLVAGSTLDVPLCAAALATAALALAHHPGPEFRRDPRPLRPPVEGAPAERDPVPAEPHAPGAAHPGEG